MMNSSASTTATATTCETRTRRQSHSVSTHSSGRTQAPARAFSFMFCHHILLRSCRPVWWNLSACARRHRRQRRRPAPRLAQRAPASAARACVRRLSVLSTSSSRRSPRSSTFSMFSVITCFTSSTCAAQRTACARAAARRRARSAARRCAHLALHGGDLAQLLRVLAAPVHPVLQPRPAPGARRGGTGATQTRRCLFAPGAPGRSGDRRAPPHAPQAPVHAVRGRRPPGLHKLLQELCLYLFQKGKRHLPPGRLPRDRQEDCGARRVSARPWQLWRGPGLRTPGAH